MTDARCSYSVTYDCGAIYSYDRSDTYALPDGLRPLTTTGWFFSAPRRLFVVCKGKKITSAIQNTSKRYNEQTTITV